MERSSSKAWSREEHREFIQQLIERDIPVFYGGQPTLREGPKARELADHLNKKFGNGRTVVALKSRFTKLRKERGWPDAYHDIVETERIDQMNDNQTKARTDSDNGWIMIDVAKFQYLYSGRNNYDVNECLMRARVDQ